MGLLLQMVRRSSILVIKGLYAHVCDYNHVVCLWSIMILWPVYVVGNNLCGISD